MRDPLVRFPIGLFGFPSEEDSSACSGINAGAGGRRSYGFTVKNPPAGFLLFMMGMHPADANGGARYLSLGGDQHGSQEK